MIVYLFFPLALIISSSLGILISPHWALAPFVWVLVIVPIIDFILPNLNIKDEDLNETKLHNLALIIILPGILFLIVFGLINISNSSITYLSTAAIGASVGMSGGSIGITTAHELIHRSNKYMRGVGIMLLVLCLYGHFRIEHIYGHHKNVATIDDPATARKGENFYFYFIRCVVMSFVSSWNTEKDLLNKKDMNTLSINNRMIHYFVVEILFLLVAYIVARLHGIIFVIFHSFVSILLLELVDYIQHYGLQRKKVNEKYERYNEFHSWNSRHPSANWSTFNLGLHSEHHKIASKHYPLLSQDKQKMEMPYNYPMMLAMALLPFVWYKVMDPKLIAD